MLQTKDLIVDWSTTYQTGRWNHVESTTYKAGYQIVTGRLDAVKYRPQSRQRGSQEAARRAKARQCGLTGRVTLWEMVEVW
jgi:hypothetical protein